MRYKTYTMEDALEVIIDYRGKTPKKSEKGIPTLSAKSVKNNHIDYDSCYYISSDEYKRFMVRGLPQIGDVLLTTEAPLGMVAQLDRNDVGIAQRLLTLRGKQGILDNEYLLYYLQSPIGQALLRARETGTTVTGIKQSEFRKIQIDIPDIENQRKIGGILRRLDDKIAVNDNINKNLEQQAKAVFKSWFEDFTPFDEPLIETPAGIYAPASLQMVQIVNIPHVLETGKRPKGGAVASGIPSIGAENVKQLGVVNFSSAKFIPEEFAAKMKTGAINGYELLLYKDGGKPGTFIPHFSMFGEGFPYQKFFINEHVFKLDFGNKGFNEFAYFFMQTDYAYHWLANNGGKAAVPGINQQNVNDIWIFSPENSKVKEFGEWVQPLFTTILKNCAQNVKLAELRDTILPKLMSGELNISALDI